MEQKMDGKGERLNAATGNWACPIPLDMAAELPPFPVAALPPIGQSMVKMVSEANQVDAGLAGAIYLGALAACVAKKAIVDVRTHTEPLNIYICVTLPSGERKSATLRLFGQPIYDYQNGGVVVVDGDITPERLGSLMSENGERLAILSTEGGIFDNMAGRHTKKNSNLDLFLKAHSGDTWSCHRMSRESETMKSPALTICITVQPEVIKMLGNNEYLRGRGLLARFLFSQCEPMAGFRERSKLGLQNDILAAYAEHIVRLLNAPTGDKILSLSNEAQQSWNRFHDLIEMELREGRKLYLLKDWGSKLPGAVARIAGLLHIGTHGLGESSDVIGAGIVNDAVVIGRYYLEHAIATFGLMGNNPAIESARKILEFISRGGIEKFKGRDIIRNTGLRTMAEVTPGLKVLIERSYIKEHMPERSGKGRPEGVAYLVNPHIHAEIKPESTTSNEMTVNEILATLGI